MAGQENLLNDAEVWDDSVLIESWNEALEEYKKYHSIHAKRGHLKELDQHQEPRSSTASAPVNVTAAARDTQEVTATTLPISQPQGIPPPQGLPQAMIGSIRDENLKKLLMSWYYAGYYTGLHEGQQQAREEARSINSRPQHEG